MYVCMHVRILHELTVFSLKLLKCDFYSKQVISNKHKQTTLIE